MEGNPAQYFGFVSRGYLRPGADLICVPGLTICVPGLTYLCPGGSCSCHLEHATWYHRFSNTCAGIDTKF